MTNFPTTYADPQTDVLLTPTRLEILTEAIRYAKLRLLKLHFESQAPYIGSGLSCLDILMTLFHAAMDDHDRFVLSKGHAAPALAATLNSIGRVSDEELSSLRLSTEIIPTHDDILISGGSPGHGLSLANGLALARSIRRQPGRIYCVLSDGECQQGSTWEALIFASHQNLPITAIVDANGLQGLGSTAEIAGMQDLVLRLHSMGIEPRLCDGHSPESILEACAYPLGLRLVVAKTIKGHGVSFMENRVEWHHLTMSESHYTQAVNEVVASGMFEADRRGGSLDSLSFREGPGIGGDSLQEAA